MWMALKFMLGRVFIYSTATKYFTSQQNLCLDQNNDKNLFKNFQIFTF